MQTLKVISGLNESWKLHEMINIRFQSITATDATSITTITTSSSNYSSSSSSRSITISECIWLVTSVSVAEPSEPQTANRVTSVSAHPHRPPSRIQTNDVSSDSRRPFPRCSSTLFRPLSLDPEDQCLIHNTTTTSTTVTFRKSTKLCRPWTSFFLRPTSQARKVYSNRFKNAEPWPTLLWGNF